MGVGGASIEEPDDGLIRLILQDVPHHLDDGCDASSCCYHDDALVL